MGNDMQPSFPARSMLFLSVNTELRYSVHLSGWKYILKTLCTFQTYNTAHVCWSLTQNLLLS